jgi:hypothetical protein
MSDRTIEDLLRAEYFNLLPEIRKVAWQLETEIRYHARATLRTLNHYEQVIVKSRVKECESAIKALQRRQEGRVFDPERPQDYSLLTLPDLAGVRVLIFPQNRLIEIDSRLNESFASWAPDPVLDDVGGVLARKYHGHCLDVSERVRAEYQIVPLLVGLFWEVEHSAMYKPDPSLKGIATSSEMKRLKAEVEDSLSRFEAGFGSFVIESS